MKKKINLIYTLILMTIGLILLKFTPMKIYGEEILFDASMHLVIAIAILYSIYLLIEKIRSWKIPYFIFSFMVLVIISLQRIVSNNHNDVGLLLGLLIAVISILIPRLKEVKNKLKK